MTDLISRQEAIRWVKTECNPYGKPTLDFESGKKVIEYLKRAPSAQPEVVRCKDCKHYDGRPCGIVDWYNTAEDFCSRAERRTDE